MNNDIIYPEGQAIALVDGAAVPIGAGQLSPSEVVRQIKSAAVLPYLGKEPDKIGMTLVEAAIYELWKKAADGDLDALDKGLNRILGKPMQTVMQATGSLKDFLDQVARSEPIDIDPLGD